MINIDIRLHTTTTNINATGVVIPVGGHQTFPLTSKAVQDTRLKEYIDNHPYKDIGNRTESNQNGDVVKFKTQMIETSIKTKISSDIRKSRLCSAHFVRELRFKG